METFNTIKACHFKMKDGEYILSKKEYYWHIPKDLRKASIQKGDIALVKCQGHRAPVYVLDVFRENIEDTGTKYRAVIAKMKNRKKDSEPVKPTTENTPSE